MAYCVVADLYLYGLPRGALASPGRLVDEVVVGDDAMLLDGHGFATGDALQFRATGGGTLPSPLAEGSTYYAIALDDWRFSVALTVDGSAINLSTAGSSFIVIAPLPVQATIDKYARVIDDMLPAHVVPVASPYPDVLVMTNAELAAADLLARTGQKSVSLTAVYDAARARVARWARGAPIRGTNAPPTAQSAATSASTSRPLPAWRRYGGIA